MSLAQLSESLVVSRRVQPSLVRDKLLHSSLRSDLLPLLFSPPAADSHPSVPASVCPSFRTSTDSPQSEICCLIGRKMHLRPPSCPPRSSSPPGGSRALRFKKALGAAATPPAVCGGTPRTGGPTPPAARPPPCPGSAGSCAVRGWRRRPTGKHTGRHPINSSHLFSNLIFK